MTKSILTYLINEKLVMLVVLINASIFIALDLDPNLTQKTGNWINWVDYGCVVFFLIELIIKVWNLGIKLYLKDNWNKFDLVIVFASIPILIEPFVENLSENFGWAPLFRLTRLLRLARFLRLSRIVRYVQYGENFKKFQLPVYLILITVASNIIINTLELSGNWIDYYYNYYPAVIILFITWFFSTFYRMSHELIIIPYLQRDDSSVNEAVEAAVSTIFQILIWAIGLSLSLESAGYNSTSILAGVGLGGMAVALAAQDFIGNLIGGILLYLQRPFEIGQKIKIGGHEGNVKKLGLRSILLEDLSGNITALPNKMFISQPIENVAVSDFSKESIKLKLDINLHSDKLKEAIQIVNKIAIDYKHIDEDYSIRFGDMHDYSHNLFFEYYLNKKSLFADNPNENLFELVTMANTDLYVEIVNLFNKSGINFSKTNNK